LLIVGNGSIGTGGGGAGTGVGGTTLGPFFDGESQLSISRSRRGNIGGGGIPGPFFLTIELIVLTWGFAGCEAIEAHVIFLG
jgi:hypothetical protein